MIRWIKLDINILDDEKIKIIRSHPDGNSIVVLWIGLLCLAMKSQRPGIIEISNALPYTIEDISQLFNIEKKTCELGLMLFRKYRMVDILDDGAIEIINFTKHQSIAYIERKRELTRLRVEKHRAKQVISNALVTRNSVTVTLTEENKNKNKNKEKHICANQEDSHGTVSKYTGEFLKFYESYPRKVGKEPAWKAWKKRNGDRPDIETLLKILEEQKRSDQWQKEGGQFVPLPATWINQGRWDDKLEEKGGIQSWLETTSQE
jgi:predicted phage replisome organizer